jgi:hypothetical protein
MCEKLINGFFVALFIYVVGIFYAILLTISGISIFMACYMYRATRCLRKQCSECRIRAAKRKVISSV